MSDTRYLIHAVASRIGNLFNGPFLGEAGTLADAFRVVGEAIEKDQGMEKQILLYLIRDGEDESRSWTIMEQI